VKYYERPSGMANLNNEGFTTTPRSECVAGVKPVFWTDDAATGGNAIRTGTLNCTVRTAQTVAFTSTAPSNPVVGQTYTPTANAGGGSGNPVVISIAAGSAAVCTLTSGVVRFNHPGSCAVKADQAGNDDFAPGTAQQSITVLTANTTTVAKPKATTIEATVSVRAPGAGTPTGTVLFAVDGSPVGSAPLSGNTATLNFTVPHGAGHEVVAAYQGDADFAGSSSTVSRLDPTITASVTSQGEDPTASGWYHTPVTVTFTCSANGSALSTSCPAPVTLATSAANQSVSRTITAEDGGSATVTVSDLDIDLDGPTVTILGVEAGKAYRKLKHPTCGGTDALSGFATCQIDQIQHGRKVLVLATAFDEAGNARTTQLTYKIKKKK
jgi:Bacterial Ig-like domain (group 3)